MTIAQKLINEGLINAKLETAQRLLTKKFGDLPDGLLNKLQKASIQELDGILDNIFDIKDLEEVEKILKSYS